MKRKYTHLKTTEEFIKRSNIKHDGKFDYSKVKFCPRPPGLTHARKRTRKLPEYNCEQNIIIVCPRHGDFTQRARKHLEGSGCSSCALETRTEALIDKNKDACFLSANNFVVEGDVIKIYQTPSHGIEREILLDEQDLEVLGFCKWRTTGHQKSRNSRTEYCFGQNTNRASKEGLSWLGRQPKLHRLVMSRVLGRELKRSELIDHVNQNGLDNRRENLRLCTHSQNHANQKKLNGNYASEFKGVYIKKGREHLGFYSCIGSSKGPNGVKRQYLGRYPTEGEAARAYDKRAKELFGEFAYLNFPEEIE